jgi:hypothetical protein
MPAANTNRKNHIFPLYLKNDSVTIEDSATANVVLPVDTSFIKFVIDGNTNNTFTLPNGTVEGQMMMLWAETASATHFATITITTVVDEGYDTVTLNLADEHITLMWNGEAWALISFAGATFA